MIKQALFTTIQQMCNSTIHFGAKFALLVYIDVKYRYFFKVKVNMNSRNSKNKQLKTLISTAALGIVLGLSGCAVSQTLQHGYVVSPEALRQVPVGASQDQVLLALGTPSTVEKFDRQGFYYISQTAQKRAAFSKGKIVNQRVIAVYFDEEGTVEQIGDFGLKDGKVFDFLTRTTPTGGSEITFLQQIFNAASKPLNNILGN
ncbi:MAG: outer membrane protein assembly factor BamE [Hyphomicrobiales bacterium]